MSNIQQVCDELSHQINKKPSPNGRRASFRPPFCEVEFISSDEDDDDDEVEGFRTSSSFTSLSINDQSSDDNCQELISPVELKSEIRLSKKLEKFIESSRKTVANVISGNDNRLLVVVGPCSIHSVEGALAYARRLKAVVNKFPNLVIIMRSYFEKPRTTVGWKGLINDPNLDNSCQIETGLRIARGLLLQITQIGLPLAIELLDTISPQYLSDLIVWGAIGARTTESQLHRELASATAHPVGFKNGTDGSVKVAIDAMKSARSPHTFMGIDSRGRASVIKSHGNNDVHVILRGGSKGTNYDQASVAETHSKLLELQGNHHPSIMIDCSHGNSCKDYRNQPNVVKAICEQLSNVSDKGSINGVMIESNIFEGRQDIPKDGPVNLKFGVSITDGCVSFEQTVQMLDDLEKAMRKRRQTLEDQSNC
ncbi:hypothetical protein O181_007018 [Austropuccinia psidii MF-1]|uniref:3-deoxy-7-phosphoheptulonate synthase n=1 Tax=Austropuccinia psidii MF-1 TaxID=1389203 RepID=A0A9Q3GH55_9BASI|nr:hypothetical protein [Austropuccinia psidii MF-1]